MSAVVCGKRSFFEESPSRVVLKQARCSSSSPVCASPSASASGSTNAGLKPPSSLLIDHLTSIFPNVDKLFLAQALEECGDDLDLAIKKLDELQFGGANMGADASHSDHPSTKANQSEVIADQQQVAYPKDPEHSEILPKDGAEWVELFVKEMTSATHVDDARARAARALESFEKSIFARASVEATQNFQQENAMLKEQLQAINDENTILKRGVAIQHERQKDFNVRIQELQHLKLLIPQYQEKLRVLEVNNYALSMHLKQAQDSNSISGRFHPDIF